MVHRFGWGLRWSTCEDYAQSSSRLPVGARTVHGLAYILIREIRVYGTGFALTQTLRLVKSHSGLLEIIWMIHGKTRGPEMPDATLFGLILTFGSSLSISHQSGSYLLWGNVSCFVPVKN
jgi:hypothetical protein